MILASASSISRFVLVILGVVLYIMGTIMRSKNQKRNAYYMELLGLVLIIVYQGLGTSFTFSWNSFDSVMAGLTQIFLLVFLICILISKVFLRRK